jgi:hypothetical protein
MNVFRRAFCLGLLPLLAACGHIDTKTAEHVDLTKYQHIFVSRLLTDGHGVADIIAHELRHRGYDALSGPLTLRPANTEIVVTYVDDWNFDFTYYMIQIDLQVSDAHTGSLLATGVYFKPSVVGRSPVQMVDAVLDKLFSVKGSPVAEPPPPPGIESESPSQ